MEGISLPVLLMAVGAFAFFLEAFIPSGGLITIIAIGSTIAAVVLAFNIDAVAGVIFLGISIVLVPVALVAAFAVFPKTPLGKRLTLQSKQSHAGGFVAQNARETELIGKIGVATSMLRPSGEARIDGRRHDVITEGEMIENGARIEVRSVEGNRIVVREVKSESEKT